MSLIPNTCHIKIGGQSGGHKGSVVPEKEFILKHPLKMPRAPWPGGPHSGHFSFLLCASLQSWLMLNRSDFKCNRAQSSWGARRERCGATAWAKKGMHNRGAPVLSWLLLDCFCGTDLLQWWTFCMLGSTVALDGNWVCERGKTWVELPGVRPWGGQAAWNTGFCEVGFGGELGCCGELYRSFVLEPTPIFPATPTKNLREWAEFQPSAPSS